MKEDLAAIIDRETTEDEEIQYDNVTIFNDSLNFVMIVIFN